METEVPFNYSGTKFGGFLNSSINTTEPTSTGEPFKWTNVEIARLIQIIFRPILVIVGTIGNVVAIFYHEENFIETFIKLFLHGSFGCGRYK